MSDHKCKYCAYSSGAKCTIGLSNDDNECSTYVTVGKYETRKIPTEWAEAVRFDEYNVRLYLDNAIVHWRKEVFAAEEANDDYAKDIAICYVDAYQSVRTSLFGSTLK